MGEAAPDPVVLVVDDDPPFLATSLAALRRQGVRVRQATGGEAALRAFAEEAIDVVLLDGQMPGMDGFETCARLRAMPGGDEVPVMMLTALEDEASIARAWQAGATDFHTKPPRWSILGHRLRFLARAARLREQLDRSRAQAERAQRVARLGHWEWDVGSPHVEVSAECARLLGLAPEDQWLEKRAFLGCFHPGDRERVAALGLCCERERPVEGGPWVFECRVPRDPEPRIVRTEAALVRSADGRALSVHAVVQDITESRRAEERIRHLTQFDALTGFANRDRFRELVGEALLGGKGSAVAMVDLRGLAKVNDLLGTEAGDQVLREAAGRLQSGLDDALKRLPNVHGAVGRPSGSEFSVLLAGAADATVARSVLACIVEALRPPYVIAGRELVVRCAAGFALHPDDGDDADELLRGADHALMAAKAGRPGTIAAVPPKASTGGAGLLLLEADLHRALERGEIHLLYQPQVDTRTGRVAGAEALMRWRRAGNVVSPADFIPLAVDTGLIGALEDWAILQACRQHRAWREAGLVAVPMGVNLTASHFLSPELLDTVAAALEETGCPPVQLELEITESVLLHDLPRAVAQMEALNALGVRVSIDDFGTGYSSLSYLRRLPIDRLKIDRAFVTDLETSREAAVLVGTMVGMSRALGLKVIGEGIETRGQAMRLFAHGCQVMQGYWFGRPAVAGEFEALLRQGPRDEWRIGRPGVVQAALRLEGLRAS